MAAHNVSDGRLPEKINAIKGLGQNKTHLPLICKFRDSLNISQLDQQPSTVILITATQTPKYQMSTPIGYILQNQPQETPTLHHVS